MPASTHVNKPVLEIDEAEFDRVFADQREGRLPVLRRPSCRCSASSGGGVIINIGSTAGLRPRPGLSAYNATKGAVHKLTKTLAVELAPDKIRVCAIAPVATETPLLPTFLGPAQGMREKFIATVPLGRLRCRRISPMRRCSWPPTKPSSSPATSWRSTAAAVSKIAVHGTFGGCCDELVVTTFGLSR